MNIINIIKMLGVVCIVTLSSCNSFLDKNPDPTKQVPTSLDEIDWLSNYSRNVGGAGYDGGTDEFFIEQFNANFSEEGRNFYKTWNIDKVTPWLLTNYENTNGNYKAIQNSNVSLELLAKIKVTDANRTLYNKIKGKCHYLRAKSYLQLAWTYCKAYDPQTANQELGMPIDEASYFGDKLKRSTLEELYAYILKEAKLAYDLLELRYPLRDEINKINVMSLLARTHLSMRQYDKAFTYADELLRQESDLLNYNDPSDVAVGTATPFKNFNRELLEILPVGGIPGWDAVLYENRNELSIDTNLIASYDPNDLRLQAYFIKAGRYYTRGATMTGTSPGPNYVTMVDEFYLTRAECYARQGDKDKALKDLNDLLVTRFKTGTYVPYTAATAEAALDIILKERKKTLVLRGLRWMDIKRLNLEGRNISIVRKVDGVIYTLPPNDPRFARPLHSVLVGDYGYEQNRY